MSSSPSNFSGPENLETSSLLLDNFSTGSQQTPGMHWRDCFPEIIGRSLPLLKILESIGKIAKSDSAVLISGESGTGKELVASALHRLSPRSVKRFVAINCSAIPESLLESELFGHEKGAFTGAVNRRMGLFEQAEGGTLFLDEIGEMPARLQAKLLRVLQEKHFTAVGGQTLKNANVRIVAATNIDLEKAVNEGRFRLDLFYRLNVLPITLPPLRERQNDVPELLQHFLERANRLHRLDSPSYFSSEVIELLSQYGWPGNVRELQNLVERLVVLCNGGEIKIQHLPEDILAHLQKSTSLGTDTSVPREGQRCPSPMKSSPMKDIIYPSSFGHLPDHGLNLPSYIEDLENSLIMQALDRTGYNKNKAAKLLGLNRTTLVERIKKRKIGPTNSSSS